MRKTLFVIYLLFLFSNQGFGQTQSIFKDDFLNNNNAWLTKEASDFAAEVSDGNYNIDLKKEGDAWWLWSPIAIDPNKPFIYRCEFTIAPNSKKGVFGLAWNVENADNNFNFAVSVTGQHMVFNTKDGAYSYPKSWTSSSKKVEKGKAQILTVKSNGSNYQYLLDDAVLCELPYYKFEGTNSVGFYVQNFIDVRVNWVEIVQDRGAMNVLSGTDLDVVKKTNLGSNVNTVYTEKKPVISHDGHTLFFVRSEDPQNFGVDKADDIWFATVDDQNQWSKAKNVGRPVNNKENNSCIGVAQDNSWIMLKGQYTSDGEYKGSGFSIASKNGEGWSNPVNLTVKNYYNNAKYQEACVSPDGNVLMFAIQREDSYGNKDLYVSKRLPDGTFSEPVNCGANVNSFAAEIGPFIAGDGKTVYYASEGLPGYGDADIFMIQRLDDSWTNWSNPVNLGPTINSAGWDAYFSTDAKGEWGYMVSTENAIGRSDIFRFRLPEKAKPKITCVVKGKIINAKTNEPMIGELTFNVLETDSLLGKIYALPSDGTFSMVLKEGLQYSIDATYPGYLGERISIDLRDVKESVEKEVVMYLKPIENETTVELNNVFFEENKAELHYSSKAQLHWVRIFMEKNPETVILIGGHAMVSGASEKFNKKLSEDRAKTVYKYLIEIGVDKKRLKYKGYGSSKPVYSGTDPGQNSKNRCVDFTIISK